MIKLKASQGKHITKPVAEWQNQTTVFSLYFWMYSCSDIFTFLNACISDNSPRTAEKSFRKNPTAIS